MKPTTFIGNKIISVIEKTGHKTFYLAEDLLISYAKPYYDANSGFTSKEAYLIHDVSIEVFTGFAEWLHAIDEGTRAGKWYPLASLCDDWTPTFIVNMFDFATSKEIPQLRNKMFHTLAHYRTGPGEFFLSEDVQSIYAQRPAKDVMTR